MSSNPAPTTGNTQKTGSKWLLPVRKVKQGIAFIKANKKRFFWLWIIYQCVKGTMTTTIIWVPLLYAWYVGK